MSSNETKKDTPDAPNEGKRDEDTSLKASVKEEATKLTRTPPDDNDIKIIVTDRSQTNDVPEDQTETEPDVAKPALQTKGIDDAADADDTSKDIALMLRADADEALGLAATQATSGQSEPRVEETEAGIRIDPSLNLPASDQIEQELEDQAQSGELRAPVLGELEAEQTWRAEDRTENDAVDLAADPDANLYVAQSQQNPKKGLLRRRKTPDDTELSNKQATETRARKGKFGKKGFGIGRHSVRSQTVQRTAEKKKGPSVWGWVKRFYMLIGGLVFFATLCIVGFVVAFPWIEGWVTNQPPSIALPSIENLRALPAEERLKLKTSAIRKAPFKEKSLASDPVPFEGGRPVELNLYRLRPVGERVKVIGKLRHYEMPDKRQFLRLTDFEMTAGYDLRILLATADNPKTREDLEQTGFVDLAALKGEVGPQNYLLPKSLNLSDFGSMVIYDQLFEIVYVTSRLN